MFCDYDKTLDAHTLSIEIFGVERKKAFGNVNIIINESMLRQLIKYVWLTSIVPYNIHLSQNFEEAPSFTYLLRFFFSL